MKKAGKIVLTLILMMVGLSMTSCGAVKKIEKQTKRADESNYKYNISNMNFEKRSVNEIKHEAEKSMSIHHMQKYSWYG